MSGLVADGTLFGLVLALTAAEGIGLVLWHQRSGRGPRPADVVGQLSAGGFLLIAALLALRGAWWGWTAASLAASGLAHLFDLRRRWQRAG